MSSEIFDPTRLQFSQWRKRLSKSSIESRSTAPPQNRGKHFTSLPKIGANMVFVPGSVSLIFDFDIAKGQAKNTVVQNLSRNLVKNFRVLLGSNAEQTTDRFDVFQGYNDLLTIEEDIMLGITDLDKRKIRTNAGDKATTGDKVMHCEVYGKKIRIPLSHPILDNHGAFCQNLMKDDLKFEIELADASEIAKATDAAKDHSSTLSKLQLEYATIMSPQLTRVASELDSTGRTFFFEDVHLFQTIPALNLKTTKDLVITVNDSRRCLKGVFIVFCKDFNAGERNTEEFVNPKINSVKTTIGGAPNKSLSDHMCRRDLWPTIRKRFPVVHDCFEEVEFHKDKFALWVDLREAPDNLLHGDGKVVGSNNVSVRLDISWEGASSDTIVTCLVFIVSDGALFVKDGRMKEILIK